MSDEKHRAETDTEEARRIMACLKACSGIPTEDLEWAAGHQTSWRRLDSLSEKAAFYANKEDQT